MNCPTYSVPCDELSARGTIKDSRGTNGDGLVTTLSRGIRNGALRGPWSVRSLGPPELNKKGAR